MDEHSDPLHEAWVEALRACDAACLSGDAQRIAEATAALRAIEAASQQADRVSLGLEEPS